MAGNEDAKGQDQDRTMPEPPGANRTAERRNRGGGGRRRSDAAEGATAPRYSPKRVLVVDDNADGAELLATVLELEGHEVVVVHDGASALRVAAEHHPNAVLLDIGLPDMDGYEVARRLRRDRGPADMMLVALTGYGREEDRQRSREVGFDHHLVKPVDMNVIRRLLREIPAAPATG